MFDDVVLGVSDYAASKAFFLRTLQPLGVTVVSEGPLGNEFCRPMRSIAQRWRQVAKTMVLLVCGRTTMRTTMRLSSLVRTGTISKWCVTNPRRNPALKRTVSHGLPSLPAVTAG